VQLRFELNARQEPIALRPKEELPVSPWCTPGSPALVGLALYTVVRTVVITMSYTVLDSVQYTEVACSVLPCPQMNEWVAELMIFANLW